MEQQNKYYTPSVEELFTGYECEYRDLPVQKTDWHRVTMDSDLFGIALSADEHGTPEFEDDMVNSFRTKYLNKEDIESCGWKPDGNDTDGCNKYYIFTGNTSWYLHHGYDNEILITKYEDHNSKGTFYNGECKSINELRTIMKWLNIK